MKKGDFSADMLLLIFELIIVIAICALFYSDTHKEIISSSPQLEQQLTDYVLKTTVDANHVQLLPPASPSPARSLL